MDSPAPILVGVTCDTIEGRSVCPSTYSRAITSAGGVPVLLPCIADHAAVYANAFDAFVFTGGEDPDTAPFGEPTHPEATVVDADRQSFETALLRELDRNHPDKPTLGVCLGMQWMALVAGGILDQRLPDTCPSHADHADDRLHAIRPVIKDSWLPTGAVTSKHHQSVECAGSMRIVACAHDGVVEAIDDPDRKFYRGVQWHPERTHHDPLGAAIYRALIDAARG